MVYEVKDGDQAFPGLSANEALARLRELIAQGHDPYLYDRFGDPMGLSELEAVVVDA